ncbi:MAG: hypothetical protein R2939_10490 [Kofleriaceae bacterium]
MLTRSTLVIADAPISVRLDERRAVARWAADCGARAAARRAGGARRRAPRQAIACARAFADGGPRTSALRAAAVAALAAARDVTAPAAVAAARAASYAASSAFMKAHPAPHHATHVLGPAVQAALAEVTPPATTSSPAPRCSRGRSREPPRRCARWRRAGRRAPPGGPGWPR